MFDRLFGSGKFGKPKDPEAQGFAIGAAYAKKKGDGFEKVITVEVDRPEILMTVIQAKIIHEKLGAAIAHIESLPDDPDEAQKQQGGPSYTSADLYPDGSGSPEEEKN